MSWSVIMAEAAVNSAAVPPLWRIVTKFAYFVGLAGVMGSAIVHVVAVRPALRVAEPVDRDVLNRRSAEVMAWSGVLLLVALYPQLAGKVARAGDGRPFGEALVPSVVGDYLSGEHLVFLQFVAFAAVGVLAALLFADRFRERATVIAGIVAPLVIAAQIVTVLGSLDGEGADFWTTTIAEYAHPIVGCTWVGGVAALAALGGTRSRLSPSAGLVWAIIWRRFSVVAEVCVGVVLVSGLWMAWKSVAGPAQVWETPYGRFLAFKVALVATLIGLGAFNEFVLLPRIARLRAAGDIRSLFRVAVEHFPRVVAVEAVIGVAVLAIVPFLNGSARAQAGGDDEPAATGSIFAAVLILLALVVVSFIVNLRLHERIDRAPTPATAGVS